MNKTDRYRQQHDELLEIATEITGYLNESTVAQEAPKVRSLLSRLLAKLKIHLAMEDKNLYPSLLQCGDQKVSGMAKSFMDEMSGIGQAVTEYQMKWSSPMQIQSAPRDFIEHTKGIFQALKDRIDKENNELYVAADTI
jgi:hemerythrin-like domain-containing protein